MERRLLTIFQDGFEVVVRPHPHSMIFEPEFIESCKAETEDLPGVSWDFASDGTLSMRKSRILISDTSSIRFDYAFLYSKPVITLEIPRGKQDEFEISYFDDPVWIERTETQIGVIVNKETMNSISE